MARCLDITVMLSGVSEPPPRPFIFRFVGAQVNNSYSLVSPCRVSFIFVKKFISGCCWVFADALRLSLGYGERVVYGGGAWARGGLS